MKTYNYNGQSYHVDNDNHCFVIETGRYHNAYTHLKTFNDFDQACAFYEAHKVSNGYKKRLKISLPDNEIIIAKQLTERDL